MLSRPTGPTAYPSSSTPAQSYRSSSSSSPAASHVILAATPSLPPPILPPPGPEHFEARRAAWLAGTVSAHADAVPQDPTSIRARVENYLSEPDAVHSEEMWGSWLKQTWKSLVGGSKLRKRLKLSTVVSILHAGWLRDGTWPAGSAVRDDSDGPVTYYVPPALPAHYAQNGEQGGG